MLSDKQMLCIARSMQRNIDGLFDKCERIREERSDGFCITECITTTMCGTGWCDAVEIVTTMLRLMPDVAESELAAEREEK